MEIKETKVLPGTLGQPGNTIPNSAVLPPQIGSAVPISEEKQPPAEPQKADPTELKIAARLAHIAKKERMLIERERQFKDNEGRYKPFEEIKTHAEKREIKEVLSKLGLSYDDITKYYLNEGKPDPNNEIARLRADIDRERQTSKENAEKAQKEQVEKAVQAFKGNLTNLVKAKGDAYELINATGAYDQVYDTIDEYFKTHGSLPQDPNFLYTVCEEIENELTDQYKKIFGLKKFTTQPTKENPGQPNSEKVPVKTNQTTLTSEINNNHLSIDDDNLDDEARRKKAIFILENARRQAAVK